MLIFKICIFVISAAIAVKIAHRLLSKGGKNGKIPIIFFIFAFSSLTLTRKNERESVEHPPKSMQLLAHGGRKAW
uniref:Putative secreted protein n=1 Tax=Anopheles darlingi TaxID=43151 RepID=A0A2M4DG97_ANODA